MCKTIKLRVKFHASPKMIYSLLINAKNHRAFTGKAASIEEVAGGKFRTYAGNISGINVDLLPGTRIVQAWRARNFPKGIFSMATFNLKPTQDGGTELTLTHRGVPKDLIPRISAEWRDLYWDKIKKYLITKNRKS